MSEFTTLLRKIWGAAKKDGSGSTWIQFPDGARTLVQWSPERNSVGERSDGLGSGVVTGGGSAGQGDAVEGILLIWFSENRYGFAEVPGFGANVFIHFSGLTAAGRRAVLSAIKREHEEPLPYKVYLDLRLRLVVRENEKGWYGERVEVIDEPATSEDAAA